MPPTSLKTKPGTPKLSDVAQRLVAPRNIVSTGWPAVHKTCTQKLGITFDPWQVGAGRLILAKRKDGHLAAMVDGVGLSVPRQVGKTYLVGAMVFALCVNMPGLLVIWSAHHARTHAETFLAMQGFAKRAKVAPHVAQVFVGSGTEEIRFHNGSRILFGARERGFGRGIPGVDILIFDEAQILSDRALANMLATMNTSRFGLQLYIGTPPKPDDMSEAFTRMRVDATEGRLTDGAWIEIGADKGAKPDDRKQWAKANPSYPLRTPAQSILRLRRKLTPEDFLREGMGIWDEIDSSTSDIDPHAWRHCAKPKAVVDGARALGLDVTLDQSWASIAGAGWASGVVHVETVAHRKGTHWVVEAAVELQAKHPNAPLVVDERSPAAALIPDLLESGVQLVKADTAHVTDACAWMFTAITDQTVTHADDDMNAAVAGTRKRPVGDRFAWGRKQSQTDITPFNAATFAAWLLAQVSPDYDPLASLGANIRGA